MADFTSALPRELYRADQVQQLDRIAIEEFSIPGFRLMQAAGMAAFSALQQYWPQARQLLVFTGSGNNGGDGYVIAALARQAGMSVTAVEVGKPANLQGDAARARELADQQGVDFQAWTTFRDEAVLTVSDCVAVDALLGTGLDREVGGDYAEVITLLGRKDWPLLAVDIPSGLSADTGNPLGMAVAADLTISFIGMKRGLLTGRAGDHVGHLLYSSLDVPEKVFTHPRAPVPEVLRDDIHIAPGILPHRRPSSHKGDNGHVLILGGDFGYGGAVTMAAESAARSGAGLVSLLTRSTHRPAVLARRPEVMVAGTEDEAVDPAALLGKASALVIGPGLGRGEWSRNLLQLALAEHRHRDLPMVVDADALHLLAERRDGTGQEQDTAAVKSTAAIKRDNWVLTPHPGEAAVLLDVTTAAVQENRFVAVSELASEWGGCVLLKGSGSLVASAAEPSTVYLCDEGNPGMGSGGMGDILTGLIAGLLAQGLDILTATRLAACVHGEAADLAASASGERGLLATDLLPYIRQLVNPPRTD